MTTSAPHNEGKYQVIKVPSTLAGAKEPEAHIMAAVDRCGYDEDATFAIKLALEEAMTNAVRHGNSEDASKTITVRYAVSPEEVEIRVRDEGPGFCPDHVPDPTEPERLSLPCGRGIMLMRAYMNVVEFCCNGREVYMVKKNPKRTAGGNPPPKP